MTTYRHLGAFSDWAAAAARARELSPSAAPDQTTRARVRAVLGFNLPEAPLDVRVERRWERDGVAGEALSWSVGYGARTEGWLLKPARAAEPLPAVLALHDHGLFKYYGKEKIADSDLPTPDCLIPRRERAYGGRAFANELARAGFVVLAHDCFSFGSRRLPLDVMPEWVVQQVDASESLWRGGGDPDEIAQYNAAAFHHEFILEKYCALLGTTYAGVIAHEDRVALRCLQSRSDVLADRIGAVGLSGGGCRAALLTATCDDLTAAVVVGMMSSYPALLDQHVALHTWMFFPHGWARFGDWADLAACHAPTPLLVQYDLDDPLFPLDGMRAAHERISGHYVSVGAPENYTGEFYPGPHKFDAEMQTAAFAWLRRWLGKVS